MAHTYISRNDHKLERSSYGCQAKINYLKFMSVMLPDWYMLDSIGSFYGNENDATNNKLIVEEVELHNGKIRYNYKLLKNLEYWLWSAIAFVQINTWSSVISRETPNKFGTLVCAFIFIVSLVVWKLYPIQGKVGLIQNSQNHPLVWCMHLFGFTVEL